MVDAEEAFLRVNWANLDAQDAPEQRCRNIALTLRKMSYSRSHGAEGVKRVRNGHCSLGSVKKLTSS